MNRGNWNITRFNLRYNSLLYPVSTSNIYFIFLFIYKLKVKSNLFFFRLMHSNKEAVARDDPPAEIPWCELLVDSI